MFTTRITTFRRAAAAPPGRPAAQQPASPHAPLETAWEAIVAQLRATPSEGHADEPGAPEYAWARKLGMHINRPPKRRRR